MEAASSALRGVASYFGIVTASLLPTQCHNHSTGLSNIHLHWPLSMGWHMYLALMEFQISDTTLMGCSKGLELVCHTCVSLLRCLFATLGGTKRNADMDTSRSLMAVSETVLLDLRLSFSSCCGTRLDASSGFCSGRIVTGVCL